ncbi:hypothetical protein N7533_007886 [Penicillium manginii]|uniref:uncharacterized protein n=1 Tax=Penicillium manginii TaxID=203109 RepID=UPI002548F6C3|nr:uncharacterized protein N7533_007886 [Penicillium manginii]KAJ5750858.1 hypothetical protein N7533_007886 [Penicillium manginii]
MSTPIVFITGANTGLGLEIVKALFRSSKAYTILLGGRSIENAEAAAYQVREEYPNSSAIAVPIQIDIEDDESIEKACDYIRSHYARVDVLINNAGASFDQQWNRNGAPTMREIWNRSWDVNTTGTHILTYTCAPLLLQSADPRLLFITSGTSTLGESDNLALGINRSPEKGWPKSSLLIPAYRSSKTGMNMMMREWRRILNEDGVKTWCVSPGFLATGLGGDQEMNQRMGAIDPTIGAEFVRDVVEGARDQDVGQVIRRDGIQPW